MAIENNLKLIACKKNFYFRLSPHLFRVLLPSTLPYNFPFPLSASKQIEEVDF